MIFDAYRPWESDGWVKLLGIFGVEEPKEEPKGAVLEHHGIMSNFGFRPLCTIIMFSPGIGGYSVKRLVCRPTGSQGRNTPSKRGLSY